MTLSLESTLVGVAGEYLVAGELTLRGYNAAITLRNSRGIDIIASDANGSKTVSIQVKSNSSGLSKWILGKKSEDFYAKNHFYIFVAISELAMRPDFYVVPSRIVARYITKRHEEWISGTKRDGSVRMRSRYCSAKGALTPSITAFFSSRIR